MKNNRYILIFTFASIALILTLFAPLAKQTSAGLFNTYSNPVTLFGGVPEVVIVLTVVFGLAFVLFSGIYCLGRNHTKGLAGARFFGIGLLIMQVISIILALNYYDSRSLMGAIRSEVSDVTIHPVAIITLLLTIVAVIMCIKSKKGVLSVE